MTIELHLGDCMTYMKSMKDKSVDCCLTDPPYGIGYASARRTHKEDRFDIIAGDTELDLSYLKELRRIVKDISCLFLFCRWDTSELFRTSLSEAGFNIQSQVIWNRGIHGLGDLTKQYAPMHDNCWFATVGNYSFPAHRPKSVYSIDRLSANELVHPTQKPVSLMSVIIKDLTRTGDTVFDPYMGSGTTGVACVQTGRNFIGCEIDEGYFHIAERRIAEAQLQDRLF
jgi:DNA modification methylase